MTTTIKKKHLNWIIHKVWRPWREGTRRGEHRWRPGQLLPVCHGHGSCVSSWPPFPPLQPLQLLRTPPSALLRLLRRRMAAGSTRWQVALRTADNFRRRLSATRLCAPKLYELHMAGGWPGHLLLRPLVSRFSLIFLHDLSLGHTSTPPHVRICMKQRRVWDRLLLFSPSVVYAAKVCVHIKNFGTINKSRNIKQEGE